MSATVMSFCNQKGGVGKTSTTALVSYNLSKLGYKTLVIDFDPQANITQLFLKTKTRGQSAVATINKSLMTVLQNEKPLTSAVLSINQNLDLIPTAVDFSLYGRFLENKESDEKSRVAYFRKLLEEQLIDHYDFIFIDVPPTLGLSNDTAFYACDQIIIVLQTQERSLVGAEYLLEYLQRVIINSFQSKVDVIGLLPVLSKRDSSVDAKILQAASEEFGEDNIFDSHITIMERVKRMDMTGITDNDKDAWDRKTQNAYKAVAEEIIERLNKGKQETDNQ